MERPKYVLVTGATGFIGAHIVDELLRRGFRVRGSTRTLAKGEEMIKTREQYADKLDFIEVGDFENTNVFDGKMEGIDGIIHVASPFTYDVKDNERELIRPAKNGVHAIMSAAAAQPNIKRIVITSSFAAVLNADRKAPPYFDYTTCIPGTSPVIAYRAAKKYAELVAWDWIRATDEGKSRHFDLVTLCPPMTFGPIVHPVSGVSKLNESNAMLWKIAKGETPLPVARVPFWIDVRDLAVAHVEALLRPEAGGKRYLLGANDRFSYGLAAKIMTDNFDWARGTVAQEEQVIDTSHGLENITAANELGLNYRTFDQTVIDLVTQARKMGIEETKS
ncbi:NAD dependent epimerase/dehydratase [Colletotrichum asianum]